MIALPTTGISRSIKKHNIDVQVLTDWIEVCALLDSELSLSDVVDILIENNVYNSQEFAWQIVDSALAEVQTRSRRLGEGYPFRVRQRSVVLKSNWTDFAPYVFCLVLSMSKSHSAWAASFGPDYTVQGELFEKLSSEAVSVIMSGWRTFITGWSRTRAARINGVVERICEALNESSGQVERWTKKTAKEAGLDMVSYRPFLDNNVGIPVLLWQCASGSDWHRKRRTPDLPVWQRIISWAVYPNKAMSIPFTLSDEEMRQSSCLVEGLLLDRCRLLEPGSVNSDWISIQLRNEIIDWLNPRLRAAPAYAVAA